MGEANASFGLPLTAEEQIVELRAKLKAAEEKLAAIVPASEPVQNLDSQGFPKEYVRLQIFQGGEKGALTHVPIGIRGYVVNVERGKEVVIHKAFADVLKDAVEDVTVQSEGGLITRPSHRFPFQILGPATEAEYLAFHANMKAGASSAAVRA